MNNFFLSLILIFAVSTQLFAATIAQSKGSKILLSLDGDKVTVGQQIILKNSDGKKVAIATITQVKGEKAIANITKGKADGSESVEIPASAATDSGGSDSNAESDEDKISPDAYSKQTKNVYRLNNTKVAVLLTAGMNSMITKQADLTTNTEDVALKGSSVGLTGSLDFPFNSWLILRGTLGYEPFTATGTSTLLACDNLTSRECNALISYLSAGGFARINFTKSRLQLWGAFGGTGKFPLSKTSTALKTDDIKMTVTFGGALGVDYFISNKSFIPVSTEFQMFQSSDTVTANLILFRIGYGWAF